MLIPLLVLLAALPSPAASGRAARASCKPQRAHEFLKRSSFVKHGHLDGAANERALRWRVEHYGRVDGIALPQPRAESAHRQATSVRFFGLPLAVHRAIVPALRCVERRIQKTCKGAHERYRPRAVGGFRDVNTYRGGEVSNHLFGIAIDIDPDKNPCCGCVQPWSQHPACQNKNADVFARTALPMCWINAFERYGFYWLGRDPQLRDTMHFEFLGEP